MKWVGGDAGSCLYSLPASAVPGLCCWDGEEQTQQVKDNALSWHPPASALLSRAGTEPRNRPKTSN